MFRRMRGLFSVAMVAFLAMVLATRSASAQTEEDVGDYPPTQVRAADRDITGVVRDQDGQLVVDATVLVFRYSASPDKAVFAGNRFRDSLEARSLFVDETVSTRTDAHGEFVVKAEHIRRPSRVYVYHPDFAVSLSGIDHQPMEIVLASGVTATGRVVDEAGLPLADVTVQASTELLDLIERGDNQHLSRTDENGQFELPHLALDENLRDLHLKLSRSDLLDARVAWFSNTSSVNGIGARLPSIQTRSGGDEWSMERAARLKLVGVNEESGEEVPLDFVKLMPLYRVNQPDPVPLSPGDHLEGFQFAVKPGEYEAVCIPQAESGLLGKRIRISLDQPGPIEKQVHFSRGCQLSGTVVNSVTDLPVAGVTVSWLPDDGESLLADGTRFYSHVQTDEAGRFSLVVPRGKGMLAMLGRVPGYVTVKADFRGSFPAEIETVYTRSIDTKPGESRDDIEFRLPPGQIVRGRVRNAAGDPASSVACFGHYSDASHRYGHTSGITDEAGRFTFTNMFDDAMLNEKGRNGSESSLRTTDADLLEGSIMLVDTESGNFAMVEVECDPLVRDPVDLDIILDPAAEITGRVVKASTGEPVANARVTAWLPHLGPIRNIWWQTTTNIHGQYRLTGLPPEVQVTLRTETSSNGLQITSEWLKIQTQTAALETVADPIDLTIPQSAGG